MSRKTLKAATGLACLAAAAVWAEPASATNGYFVNGYDVSSQGMAGAGLTEGDGPVSSAYNPAVGVKMGNVAGACLSFFMPQREISVGSGGALTPGEYNSSDNLFLIPCMGANTLINDKTALGLTMVANGGMETRYTGNPFKGLGVGSSPLGVNLQQALMSLNVAHKFTNSFSLGIAPVLAAESFRAYGLEAFGGNNSQAPNYVTGNGDDWVFGGGARLGGVWDANRYVSVAAAYQTRMWMGHLKKYSGLFADNGNMDIPPEVSLGATVRPISSVAVSFDWNRIFYSEVPSIGNTELVAAQLGAANGPGFGWKDMNVYHIGAKWDATDALTLRTGWSYATDAFNPDQAEFNLISPGIIKQHAAIGASYKLTPKWRIDGSYVHAFSNTVNGIGNPGFGSGSQPLSLKLSEDIATVGFTYHW